MGNNENIVDLSFCVCVVGVIPFFFFAINVLHFCII